MTTSGPVFPTKKLPARPSQFDVHAAQVTSKVHLRQLKNRHDANESLAVNRLSRSLKPTLKLRIHPNPSIVSRAANERRIVWNVRLQTSNHRQGCDISVPTNWILATTTMTRHLPAVVHATLPTKPAVEIRATNSIVDLHPAAEDSAEIPGVGLDRENRVATPTVATEDQNAAAAVAVVRKVLVRQRLAMPIVVAMRIAVATDTAVAMTIVISKVIGVQMTIAMTIAIKVPMTIVG